MHPRLYQQTAPAGIYVHHVSSPTSARRSPQRSRRQKCHIEVAAVDALSRRIVPHLVRGSDQIIVKTKP
jgi:hypothetical protein